MKKLLILTLIISSIKTELVLSQRRIIEKFIANSNDTTRRGRFIIVPALGYAQETGFEYGIVGLASFFTDKDTLTRASNVAALVAFTTKNQSIITIKPDIWSKQNRYHYVGDLRYRDFPFNFYGIGNETKQADEEKITQKLVRLGLEAEKQIRQGAYTGVTLTYENYEFKDEQPGGLYETSPFIRDRDGGEVLFLGLSQIIDSRNTNTYTTRGTYFKLNYAYAPPLFGGANFTGSLARLDFRTFKSYNPKTVLGFNFAYQSINGDTTPFYLLPQLGNDQLMRGYYTGRYRDRNLLAGQLELKYRVIPRIGAVAFGGLGSVHGNRFALGDLKPSYGGGLRYFFDPSRGLSLRMDYAFGEKRSGEERQKGFYLALGESF
jgi:hypothetical protein